MFPLLAALAAAVAYSIKRGQRPRFKRVGIVPNPEYQLTTLPFLGTGLPEPITAGRRAHDRAGAAAATGRRGRDEEDDEPSVEPVRPSRGQGLGMMYQLGAIEQSQGISRVGGGTSVQQSPSSFFNLPGSFGGTTTKTSVRRPSGGVRLT